jgi:hypothetical protein
MTGTNVLEMPMIQRECGSRCSATTRCPRPTSDGVSTKTAAAPAPVGMPELAQFGRRYDLTQQVGGALGPTATAMPARRWSSR